MMNLRKIDLSGTDYWARVSALRRPRLLIRAAGHAMADYRRERDLPRLLGSPSQPTPQRALALLLADEGRLNDLRLAADAGYDARQHILALAAILAEMQSLPRPVPHLFVVPSDAQAGR
jgi:hypothetical protein